MKFIISSSYLKDHLQILGGVISTNNTLPILDHILFDLKEQSLKLIASDLETTISAELEVDSTDSGLIALPAKLLLDTLKTFAEQPLTFIVSDNGTVEISAANGKYALAGADGNDFPKPVSLNDTADFEMLSLRAASVNPPWSITAAKASISLNLSISHPFHHNSL
mgnify:CR=1 FL=1